jgi:ribosomal protein S11
MLAPVDIAGPSSPSVAVAAGTGKSVGSSPATASTPGSGLRQAVPHDSQFLTVEPDGRDDISFQDRLRHALRTVFAAVQKPDEAAEAAERALQAAAEALDGASASEGFLVQIRIVGVDVAFSDQGAGDEAAYASYRRLGVEIGVARDGAVRAEDTSVVGLDGRSFGLTAEQTRTGLSSGHYRLVETGGSSLSTAARERLEAAQTGLARVKAAQDALKAYRSGDIDPLKKLLVDGEGPAGGKFGAVFPGIGALAIN